MDLDKFEEPTKRILSCEILRDIQSNQKLIDNNWPMESEKFVSAVAQTVKKANEFESVEDTNVRIRKLDELDERLKNFKKNFKKEIKRTDNRSCELHHIVPSTTLSVQLNAFLEKDLSAKDVESVIREDEKVIQQHASNLEKMSKFMLVADGVKIEQPNVPAAEMVNECTTLLREVIKILRV